MGTIAKGEITLNTVYDAYTVSITPASCTINTDFDGLNQDLDNAKGVITVKRGSKELTFHLDEIRPSSTDITVEVSGDEGTEIGFEITYLSNQILSGYIDFDITVLDTQAYTTTVRFSFTVVRESSMLDWIRDWEGTKTKIGGTYIMTPKLFVGSKEDVVEYVDEEPTWKEGALTGVYLGPDLTSTGESGVGVYGYLKDKEIFHINSEGGLIGGWSINEAGLQSNDGTLNILASGSIYAQNQESSEPYWGIYSDGYATFANGNVTFKADGSASFRGEISASSGNIAGWSITPNQLQNNRIVIDSTGFIGINASVTQTINIETGEVVFPDDPIGGVKMWYRTISDFGLAGWSSSGKVFQLGSTNIIAGWNFNTSAIWSGSEEPYLTQNAYAINSGELTLAPNGLRSNKWYIDADGTAAFVGGSVEFGTDSAEMFGWLMRDGRFSSSHAALISQASYCGLFVSPADLSEISASSLVSTIDDNGGIYIYSNGDSAFLKAYDKSGDKSFYLTTDGYNSIAAWRFDNEALYVGSKALGDNGFAEAEAMVLQDSGVYGHMWKLAKDGSGALAGGNISWDKDGVVSFNDSVKLFWENGVTASQIMAFGTMLYRDPEFSQGLNDTQTYLYSRHVSLTVGDYLSFLQTNGIKLIGTGCVTKIRIKGVDEALWSGSQWLSSSESFQFVAEDVLSDLTESSVIVFETEGENGTILLTDDATVYYLCAQNTSYSIGTIDENVVRTIIYDDTAPNDSGKALSMTVTRWVSASDLRLGGFAFANQSKKNGKFLVRIVANIPVGWKICNYHNPFGDDGKSEWITSQSGTGEYAEYLCLVTCGSSGSFDEINYFALTCDGDYVPYDKFLTDDALGISVCKSGLPIIVQYSSVTWNVAVATVYDGTSSDKVTTTIDKNGIYTGTLRADQIVAGTINSKFINTEGLTVQHILAGDSEGKHVEINPDSQQITIYDEDGTLGTSLSGDTYSGGVDEIFEDTKSAAPNLDMYYDGLRMRMGKFESLNTTGQRNVLSTIYSEVWYSDAPVYLTFDAGKVVLLAYSAGYDSDDNDDDNTMKSYAEAYVSFALEVADDENFTKNVTSYPIWSSSEFASSSQSTPGADGYYPSAQSSTSSANSLMNNRSVKSKKKGYHRIRMDGYVEAKMEGSTAQIIWGSAYSDGTDLAATYINEFYVSRYFANGFCLGISASQYVSVWKDSSEKMHFKAEESGYGLMLSEQGIKYKHHSGNWMQMPLLVWKGVVTYNSYASTPYTASTHVSFDGSDFKSVTRKTNSDDSTITKNHIHIVMVFPDAWASMNLTIANTIVNVVGYGDSLMKVTLVSIQNNSMTIEISDDASANDGSLSIELYTIG